MNRLKTINSTKDIPVQYQQTPIARLLEYHNLQKSLDICANPELIIGTCVDNRIQLRFPVKFAYIVRAGGANMKYNEFKISYAIALGDIKHIALIGHNHCGMSNLIERKEQFIQGLVKNAGWSVQQAKIQFENGFSDSEIGNEVDFILNESKRLQNLYPKMMVVPMMYLVENNQLYLIQE